MSGGRTMYMGFLLVVNDEFNRRHSSELIGKRYPPESPPSYTNVRYERDLLAEMTSKQLVSVFNSCELILANNDPTVIRLHQISDELLNKRGINRAKRLAVSKEYPWQSQLVLD